MNDQSDRADAIVEVALDLPREELSAFLDEACEGDATLRQLVEALLKVHQRVDGLRRPAGPPAPAETSAPPVLPTEKGGDRIGRYKLLEKIGEGGCGIVYMAEQKEPVKRRVAFKIIKLGMDTRQVVARFEAERQALALMDHPNIAKVLEAGATDTGRPYFVMELVRGIKITDYCDQNQLSTEQRLNLFVQVCGAVQHAHQKGIIHRDIKPSNILVADHDGTAVPKVIDFGIAKATTDQQLTDKTLFTAFEQFIGTPAYMSPEQAKLSGIDIDTRSDIYSLGVLLYELLTGQTPFEPKRLVEAGLDEVRRIIREEEPPRPSTRLHTLDPAKQTTVAKCRQTDAPKLVHRIRGDLDWIVMKCLEKERARRYETANGLARDIQRHLNDEPVQARPPSRLYEFQKTVRRHKFGIVAVTAIMVVLVAGVVSSSLEATRARQAERQAVKSAASEAKARSEALERLYEAKLGEARAKRLSGVAGRRFESLAAIAEAATIHGSRELSDEALACLALVDLRVQKTFDLRALPRGANVCFNNALELCAHPETNGVRVRRVADSTSVAFLPVAGDGHTLGHVAFDGFDSSSRRLAFRFIVDGGPVRDQVWALDEGGKLIFDAPGRDIGGQSNFRADGQVLALASGTGVVSLIEVESGKKLGEFKAAGDWPSASFSPDGSKLATWTTHPFGPVVQIRDLASDLSSAQLGISLCNSNPVETVRWNWDGSLVACATRDGPIWVWDIHSGKVCSRMEGHSSSVVVLAFAHRGDLLASSSWDETTRLWEVASGRQLVIYPKPCQEVRFSPDDERLAGACEDGKCTVFTFAGNASENLLPSPPAKTSIPGVTFTRDGRVLAFASAGGIAFADVQTGRSVGFLRAKGATGLSFGPPIHPALYAITAGGLVVWELGADSDAVGAVLRFHPPRTLVTGELLRDIVLDREGRRCATSRGEAVLVNLEDPSAATRFCPHPGSVFASLDPTGRWAASGTWRATGVRVWDFPTGHLVRELPVAGSASVAFSPDGNWLATASSSEFRLWRTGSWVPQRESLRADSNFEVGTMAFSPDTRLLATCHDAQQIQLVRVPSLEVVAKLLAPPNVPFTIASLCFSPDGTRLAALEYAGMVHLWDLRVIRAQLKELALDWDLPPYPAADEPASATNPLPRLDCGPFSRQELARAIPPRDTNAPANLIDLTAYYNAPLAANWHPVAGGGRSDLSELPAGRQKLAGVEFDVRGLVQIGYPGANGLSYPDHIEGIPIRRSCHRLHFLHSAIAAAGARLGDKLGSYTIQYVDGREVEIPIIAGTDVVDWWSQPNEAGMKRVIAWEGNTPLAKKYGHTVRLFKTTWDNPYPTVPIRQFNFVVDNPSRGAPFLVALTAEP